MGEIAPKDDKVIGRGQGEKLRAEGIERGQQPQEASRTDSQVGLRSELALARRYPWEMAHRERDRAGKRELPRSFPDPRDK